MKSENTIDCKKRKYSIMLPLVQQVPPPFSAALVPEVFFSMGIKKKRKLR